LGLVLVGVVGCGRSGLDAPAATDAGASAQLPPDLPPADLAPSGGDLAPAAQPDPEYCRGRGGDVIWAKSFDADLSDPQVVATRAGDVYLSGDVQGAITLGGTVIRSDPYVTVPFLGKFDSEGHYRWSSRFAYLGALDGSGNVWLGPVFFLDATIDPGYQTELVVVGSGDGKPLPVREYGAAWPLYNAASLVAVDSAGDFIAVGVLDPRTNSFLGQPVTVGADGGLFLTKLTPAGEIVWLHSFDASVLDRFHPYLAGSSLSIDGSGNIWMTVALNAPGGIGGPPLNGNYVVKYDQNGTFVLQQPIPGDSPVVAVSASGNAVVAATLYSSQDAPRMFVRKLDPSGVELWARSFVFDGVIGPFGLAIDADENVAWLGLTGGVVDFGGGPLTLPAGGDRIAPTLLKLDRNGSHVWSKRGREPYLNGYKGTSGSDTTIPRRIAFDGAGDLYATFDLAETMDLCGTPLTIAPGARNGIALIKLAP
jgi:hypothetical protein